jgi:hypothetical protein
MVFGENKAMSKKDTIQNVELQPNYWKFVKSLFDVNNCLKILSIAKNCMNVYLLRLYHIAPPNLAFRKYLTELANDEGFRNWFHENCPFGQLLAYIGSDYFSQ